MSLLPFVGKLSDDIKASLNRAIIINDDQVVSYQTSVSYDLGNRYYFEVLLP